MSGIYSLNNFMAPKTKHHNEEALRELLKHMEIVDSGKIRLEGFFDIMDEHGVVVEDEEIDEMAKLVDENGEVDKNPVFDYVRQAKFFKILVKREVYADEEILKKMSGPAPRISKLDTIIKQMNKVGV